MKVVLDTNILIDGVKDENSVGARIVNRVLGGKLEACLSRQLEKEYRRIIAREITEEKYVKKIENFIAVCHGVELKHVPRVIKDDPEDDKVLATAIRGGVDYLVSEDDHLLKFDGYEGVKVVTARQLVNIIEEDDFQWSDFASFIGLSGRN